MIVVWYFEEGCVYFEKGCVVCTLKRVVWYLEEGGVVLFLTNHHNTQDEAVIEV